MSTNRFSQLLIEQFGPKSPLAREGIATLVEILENSDSSKVDGPLDRWKESLTSSGHFWFDDETGPAKTACPFELLARQYNLPESTERAILLFALQTYFVIVVQALVQHMMTGRPEKAWSDSNLSKKVDRLLTIEPFDWFTPVSTPRLTAWHARVTATIRRWKLSDLASELTSDDNADDLWADWYQKLFPRRVRHRMGEYYTPPWLAGHLLDVVERADDPTGRLLDPACGSGIFLIETIRRRRRAAGIDHKSHDEKARFARQLSENLAGFDLNPLAVVAARAQYLLAIGDLLDPTEEVDVPIFQKDSLLDGLVEGETQKPFDLIVGNPPWIAWDHLPSAYREATRSLWKRYGLFSLSGNEARHGGGKKDLAMLMLYVAADRYLGDGGRLAFVITQSVFQTKGAGDGFRRFQLGEEGIPLEVLQVDDFTSRQPFPGASTRTATVLLTKGSETTYPVPYYVWPGDDSTENPPAAHRATPIDPEKPRSPWSIWPTPTDGSITGTACENPFGPPTGPSDYQAHLGANTGGANGVYWVESVRKNESGILVRNLPKRSKRAIPQHEATVEPKLLYPLIRWRDLKRWQAVPGNHILLVQDLQTRTGLELQQMQRDFPQTLAFLKPFKSILTDRAAYRRYQDGHPFYSMYNLGTYSVAPIRVVWRRMDRRINAAVLQLLDDPLLGPRPPIVQETCVQVAVDSLDEAFYLAALLNSQPMHRRITSHSTVGAKSFGTPGMLSYTAIRRFDPDHEAHQTLATLGEEAHRLAEQEKNVSKAEEAIDRTVARWWKNEYTTSRS